MSEGKDPADGRPSLRRFGAAFLGLLHGHVELFGIELQEQKANTLRLLLFAGLAWYSPCSCWSACRCWC